VIIIHSLGQAPEGCLAAPDTARMGGRAWSPIDPRHTFKSLTPCVDGLSVVTRVGTLPGRGMRGNLRGSHGPFTLSPRLYLGILPFLAFAEHPLGRMSSMLAKAPVFLSHLTCADLCKVQRENSRVDGPRMVLASPRRGGAGSFHAGVFTV
jgi:hypothetical protein